MKQVIGIGKNIEQAIENGLKEIGLSQDDVTIKVLSEGGLFSKAKVEITADSRRDEYVKEEKKKEEIRKETSKPEKKIEQVNPARKTVVLVDEVVSREDIKKAIPTKKEEQKKEVSNAEKKTEERKKKIVSDNCEKTGNKNEQIEKFLTNLLSFSKAQNLKIETDENDTQINASVTGEGLSSLIGSGGETLNCIQFVASVVSGKNKQNNKRVSLDIGGYKKDKENRLCDMAERARKRVLETGQSYKFQPMTSFERRIIHNYLNEKDGIKTFSKGQEPRRFLIVEKE